MIEFEQAARSIAEAALGMPVGLMQQVASQSHHVFVSAAVVVKLIEVADHPRLDREIALALDLPTGLSAPVLASGVYATTAGEVRYACLARLAGSAPGLGLAGVERATACRWARQAIQQLQRLHGWAPAAAAVAILREQLDHGGFVGRAHLLAELDRVHAVSDEAMVPRPVLAGLAAIAARAPEHAETTVPVHADCHWGNWLVHEQEVTALLDFEWARFGAPADDWMFLARFSGAHQQAVLGVIADVTSTPLDALRAACEVREAAYLTSDLRLALQAGSQQATTALVRDLRELVIDRSWWQTEV